MKKILVTRRAENRIIVCYLLSFPAMSITFILGLWAIWETSTIFTVLSAATILTLFTIIINLRPHVKEIYKDEKEFRLDQQKRLEEMAKRNVSRYEDAVQICINSTNQRRKS